MDCPDCGNPVEKDAKFCPKCYARIETPVLWKRLLRLFQSTGEPRQPIIKINESIRIQTTDEKGQRHEYHSLAEAPPELRAELEKLQSEALKEVSSSSTSDGPTRKFITRKTVSIFKLKDRSGNEIVYHSLDELPPDIRAALKKAQDKQDNK